VRESENPAENLQHLRVTFAFITITLNTAKTLIRFQHFGMPLGVVFTFV